jgi:predicted nucleic acid-binding protein
VIILDTNVLSEFIRPRPEPRVVAWLDAQSPATLAVTAITVAEMLVGIEVLADGKRKRLLGELVGAALAPFQSRLLPFDEEAARKFSIIVAMRQRAGRRIGTMDAQIAAIATTLSASVATRDVADFSGIGLDLIDPWSA